MSNKIGEQWIDKDSGICWLCNDEKTVEHSICGWCMAGVLHSSCDDTYHVVSDCEVCSNGPSEEEVQNDCIYGKANFNL